MDAIGLGDLAGINDPIQQRDNVALGDVGDLAMPPMGKRMQFELGGNIPYRLVACLVAPQPLLEDGTELAIMTAAATMIATGPNIITGFTPSVMGLLD
jgi:hypothetical protein